MKTMVLVIISVFIFATSAQAGFSGKFRIYNNNRDFDNSVKQNTRAFAIGGNLSYETESWYGLQAKATLYSSHDIGINPEDPALQTPLLPGKTIDILGLNNSYIAHTQLKSDTDYVMSHNPKIIQLHLGLSEDFIPKPTKMNNSAEIFFHLDFIRSYELYRAGLENPNFPLLFIRNKNQKFQQQWVSYQ